MDNQLIFKQLRDIDLTDIFFDSLREDYIGFDDWFNKKANEGKSAFTLELNSKLNGFLFVKSERGSFITDVIPMLPKKNWIKIGTFKINPHGTRLGERFLKKVFDLAFLHHFDGIYVTIFPKHKTLINLFKKYGFQEQAVKTTNSGTELVLVKELTVIKDDILLDYPKFKIKDNQKYLLPIFPKFHTSLFPDSILNNESYSDIQDISHTNSIEKIYICSMNCSNLKKGDCVLIYRTSDGLGSAHFRSVVTSVCTINEIKTRGNFNSLDDYLIYCEIHSVFNRQELTEWYNNGKPLYIIKMVYNGAFKRRMTRGNLIEKIGLNGQQRWGLYPLTNDQFNNIIKQGDVYESLIIN